MYSRRTFLKISAVLSALVAGGFLFKNSGNQKVKHILSSASHERLGISLSLSESTSKLELILDQKSLIKGKKIDQEGKHWQFISNKLVSDRSYQLQLLSEDEPIYKTWKIKTFPDPEAETQMVSIMSFTCPGGGDAFRASGREFFKPFSFRQNIFKEGLAKNPDFAISIGDHVYWDLRGESSPPVGRNSKLIKFFLGGYLRLRYGAFNRLESADSETNESVLKKIGNEQIASLYGTRFKSTPIFFIPDDHDYFENDDAEEEIVTFPADKFSKGAFKKMADLFYPPLLDTPDGKPGRSIGRIRYGNAFEGLIADCAGNMTLGNKDAVLISKQDEEWLLSRIEKSKAKHLAFIPSHPFGYTAGKWREWYPDVVAEEGASGTVVNELLSGRKGSLTTKANKYLWQEGWFLQHQRLIKSISERKTSRFIFSGDIHAIAAASIIKSGEIELENRVKTFLVGPVSSSTGTWPSFARGITAENPDDLVCESIYSIKEENGFTFFRMENDQALAEIVSCGGHNPDNGESGKIVSKESIYI
ncbi:MAG: twin-arginine translocation signal domain-containing protein [Gammaproteobacteria bacterium]